MDDSVMSFKSEIAELRRLAGDLLTEKYDTDFNLLRWIKGYHGNIEECKDMFLKHLKFRRFFDLDNIGEYPDDYVTSRFFPLGLLGETGKDNRFVAIEAVGKIDLQGLLKSIQVSRFLRQRLKFQENVLEHISQKEKATGHQSGVIYIMDLEGLHFDHHLIPALTGPYLLLWTHVVKNYPEWVAKIIVINAPSFTPILWKAICHFISDITRNKIEIFSGKSHWEPEIAKFVQPDHLPVHWGGTLVDKNGDPMCRSKLVIPTEKVPKELYWQPNSITPAADTLDEISISAGNAVYLNFDVADSDAFLLMHKFSERTYSMAIYFFENDSTQASDWCPDADYPGLPSVDTLKVKTPGRGIYRFKFGNERAWFRSLSLRCSITFVDPSGKAVHFKRISQPLIC